MSNSMWCVRHELPFWQQIPKHRLIGLKNIFWRQPLVVDGESFYVSKLRIAGAKVSRRRKAVVEVWPKSSKIQWVTWRTAKLSREENDQCGNDIFVEFSQNHTRSSPFQFSLYILGKQLTVCPAFFNNHSQGANAEEPIGSWSATSDHARFLL